MAFSWERPCWLPRPATAGPALVFEPYNGTVFYAEDPDRLWFPASLTKLMTAYVTFKAIKDGKITANTPLVCTKTAAAQAPSKLGLPIGGQITVDDALKVLIVKSANDVAVMLAEKVAGSVDGFVNQMNEEAHQLGMTRTRFVNPNGLPGEGQMTTARDLAKLTRAIIVDFPEYADVFAMPSVTVGKKVMRSHNGLLRSFAGADGMKTGFICNFRLQRGGERHPRRQATRRCRARRAIGGDTHRPRLQPARERVQALFLEIGVRHHRRRSDRAGRALVRTGASSRRRVWRRTRQTLAGAAAAPHRPSQTEGERSGRQPLVADRRPSRLGFFARRCGR